MWSCINFITLISCLKYTSLIQLLRLPKPRNFNPSFSLTLSTLTHNVTLNRNDPVNGCLCLSLLEILGCDVHSILDVIKSFHRLKFVKTTPIATMDPSDEPTTFERTDISSLGWLLASLFNLVFQENGSYLQVLFRK